MLSQLTQGITTGRVVALITPTIIAPAAGFIAVQAAKWGMDVKAEELQAVFVTGATAALGIGALWLKGWQDWEKRQAEFPNAVSNDLRLEETQGAIEPDIDEPSPAAVAVAAPIVETESDIIGELEADGLDDLDDFDDIDDLEEDVDLEDELVAVGEE